MNKEEKLQITKDKLIDATYQLMMETEDPLTVTSRQIAARADVKPSMINYCFESRENLIYQVFNRRFLNLMEGDNVAELIDSGRSPAEILKEIHFLVARVLVRNHQFTRAITGYILFKRDLGKESFSYPYVLRHYNGTRTEAECRLIAYELSTMMQLIIYRKDDINRDFGIDLDDDEQLRKYINMRVDLLLGG
ncbi:MAG: TetR/AcrR family transcriptional regulator [Clostridiales bacterium]|nr:TetR/AcrR family transcriptional regulator [Clostridiales bacterium]